MMTAMLSTVVAARSSHFSNDFRCFRTMVMLALKKMAVKLVACISRSNRSSSSSSRRRRRRHRPSRGGRRRRSSDDSSSSSSSR